MYKSKEDVMYVYSTGVESFHGYHGGVGSLFSIYMLATATGHGDYMHHGRLPQLCVIVNPRPRVGGRRVIVGERKRANRMARFFYVCTSSMCACA